MLSCLFVCLFWIRTRICPAGSTPEGGPTESSPTTQATRHPRASLFFMFPIPPYLLSCILHQVSLLPCPPVLYRYHNISIFIYRLDFTYKRRKQETGTDNLLWVRFVLMVLTEKERLIGCQLYTQSSGNASTAGCVLCVHLISRQCF